MGSPLGPVLANLFMGHLEQQIFEKLKEKRPLYQRYIDDIFAVFKSKNEALYFFEFINKQHPNIKFTIEEEKNRKLQFLDVDINFNTAQDIASVYHKKIFTGLFLNYFSFTSQSYKIGLIRTLVDRIYKINNTWTGIHSNLKDMREVLLKNSYPNFLIDKIIKNYLEKIYQPKRREQESN